MLIDCHVDPNHDEKLDVVDGIRWRADRERTNLLISKSRRGSGMSSVTPSSAREMIHDMGDPFRAGKTATRFRKVDPTRHLLT